MATAAPTGAAPPAEPVIRTERLDLWQLGPGDAEFIVELLNDAAFLRFIGDKNVRDRAGALEYIRSGPVASYERHGFGLLRVALHESGEPIGICGLLKRDYLDDPDLGFALLARFRSQGYTREAATAVLEHARTRLGIRRVLAITSPDNAASIGLLEKLGFQLGRRGALVAGESELCVFSHDRGTTDERESQ